MAELDEIVGQRISGARRAAGLTQEELAAEVGIATENLSRAECGRTILRTRNLIAVADALDVSLDDLVKGREPEPRKRPTVVVRLVKRFEGLDDETAKQAAKVLTAFLDAVENRTR